jgi:hypothetical protein
VEAHIDEVRRDGIDRGPASRRVGDAAGDVEATEHADECRRLERRVADLERIADRPVGLDVEVSAVTDPMVVATCDGRRVARRPQEQARNVASRSTSNASCGGSCQRIGPSFSSSASTPDAKKFASGPSQSRSFLWCVRKRPPFTAKTKSAGVSSYQRRQLDGAGANRRTR